MAFWLAKTRDGQHSDWIQRFDPRFWTVNFPRPMMACVTSTGPDSLRVDLEFHEKDNLAGLIWESADTIDHPLLAYDTDQDYSRTTLSFRWRSGGILPLDAVNGPTLTVEGRDANGMARSWYVRLWNYADGSPQDAQITLPFSNLSGGWSIAGNPDPVNPYDIDRMFISLAAPGFDQNDEGLLPSRVDGWVELEAILCDGHRAMLPIGDVMLPPHGVQMATAYDDSYNQTPARMLRTLRGLGYRQRIVHYVGMSHFMRLVPVGGQLLADPAGTICQPATAWHENLFSLCHQQGFDPIISLSYELLAEHCPAQWQQLAHDGTPSRTGWDPPSALLSPANGAAMQWLQAVAGNFVAAQKAAGLAVRFQIGEPWWWTTADGKICLYDAAAQSAFGGAPPIITDMRTSLNAAQLALLDQAGALLAQSTANLASSVRQAASPASAQIMLLAFTPTILNPEMPELLRANMPTGWAWPAFDRLQIEDYDWLTMGAQASRLQAYQTVQQRLSYPAQDQDYLAGFVLIAENADAYWQLIDAALDEAEKRQVTERFVWALPQVARDGYTRIAPSKDDEMQAFDDVPYPLALGRDAGVSPEFSTSVSVTASGHERRSAMWSDARLRFDVGPGIRSEDELGILIAFFRARRGAARGFRLPDPFDFSSNGMTGTPTMLDQLIGVGDGMTASFQLVKRYGSTDDPQVRPISRPRAETIRMSVAGIMENNWELDPGGYVRFANAPGDGAIIRAGFLFEVPVRFAEDRIDITGAAFAAGEAPSVPLVEIREVV